MLIVIDKRVPEEAKKRLSGFGTLVKFSSQDITYPAISGHPDIFLFQSSKSLICAPNLPENYAALFKKNKINFSFGSKPVGSEFPETAFYNCLATEGYLFHKAKHTEKLILEHCKFLEFIDLPQAYTRCGLLALTPSVFITSDKGIEKVLRKRQINIHYFSPEKIILPKMPHGFIGGALGLYEEKLFVLGNPDFHSWGNTFKDLIRQQNLELISLYDGPFFDGGGIFFLK